MHGRAAEPVRPLLRCLGHRRFRLGFLGWRYDFQWIRQATICIATACRKKMSKKAKGSSKPKSRKMLDPRVQDLRKKILHLDPYSGWFPAGATKRIMSIVDAELEPIGELETGSDGFVQLAVLVGRRFVRISYYPGQPYATLTWITLEK